MGMSSAIFWRKTRKVKNMTQKGVELSGIIMEINDLRKKGRKEEMCRKHKIVDFYPLHGNRVS